MAKKTKGAASIQPRPATGLSFASLCNFMYIMIVSKVLVTLPLIGGALYLCGRVTLVFLQTFTGSNAKTISKGAKWGARLFLILILLATCFFLGFFPISPDNPMVWIIFAIALSSIIRELLIKKILSYWVNGQWRKKYCVMAIGGTQLLTLIVVGLLLTYSLNITPALLVLGGFALCGLIELYDQWKDRASLLYHSQEEDAQVKELGLRLKGVNAYHAFTVLYNLYIIALYMTIVLACTYIVISAQDILIYMLLSFVFIIASREIAFYVGKGMKEKQRDPAFEGAIGTLFWFAGMVLFGRYFTIPGKEITAYIALALCYIGATLCAGSLAIFEQDMQQVVAFHLGRVEGSYFHLQKNIKDFAITFGEIIVLAFMLVMAVIEGLVIPQTSQEMVMAFEPFLIFPATLIILAVTISVLQFPISTKYRQKLKRILQIKEAGEENAQLDAQLQRVVVKKHKRDFGIRVLITLVRPFYRHKVVGKENVPQGADGELVFICNHGSIYGPVVTNLYLPFFLRPWSISDLMDDANEAAAYLYKYNIEPIKWLPTGFKKFIARRIGAPISLWLFRSMEAIPVYRNKLRDLMKTFRLSLDAMMAEDNLLIFPENPDAQSLDSPGYLTQGVGDFYTGFTMIAPMLYNKTGKKVKFVPIYASKEIRTIAIGPAVEYNPDAQPTQEKQRIVSDLQSRMNAMARQMETNAKNKGISPVK